MEKELTEYFRTICPKCGNVREMPINYAVEMKCLRCSYFPLQVLSEPKPDTTNLSDKMKIRPDNYKSERLKELEEMFYVFRNLNGDKADDTALIWNWILSHAREIGSLI